MENSNQHKENNEILKNPKPSDDAQLAIETVTPATEKDVAPTANVNDTATENNEQPTDDQENEVEGVNVQNSSNLKENTSDTKKETTANTKEEAETPNKDSSDEGDQIETVSP